VSAVKTYYMRCDVCGYTTDDLGGSAAGARRAVREDGWTHPMAPTCQMRIDVCSSCSEIRAGVSA
jgi:hypothetical protein